jgi:hypothetical protein
MKIDAATKTVTAGEARERAKLLRALEKWVPLRRAQLALSPELNGERDGGDDAEWGGRLLVELRRRVTEEPEIDVATGEAT